MEEQREEGFPGVRDMALSKVSETALELGYTPVKEAPELILVEVLIHTKAE